MALHYRLSTTTNAGETVRQPCRTLWGLTLSEAEAAGDPQHCKEQTIEVLDCVGGWGPMVVKEKITRISQDGRWLAWA